MKRNVGSYLKLLFFEPNYHLQVKWIVDYVDPTRSDIKSVSFKGAHPAQQNQHESPTEATECAVGDRLFHVNP